MKKEQDEPDNNETLKAETINQNIKTWKPINYWLNFLKGKTILQHLSIDITDITATTHSHCRSALYRRILPDLPTNRGSQIIFTKPDTQQYAKNIGKFDIEDFGYQW